MILIIMLHLVLATVQVLVSGTGSISIPHHAGRIVDKIQSMRAMVHFLPPDIVQT